MEEKIYNSTYDYTIYDMGFIFYGDEEDEGEIIYDIEQDYFEINQTGIGGNFH
jgi:hypothetical protein